MGFSRQEYWSGLPFPSPGDLSDPGIDLRSPTLWAESLPSEPLEWRMQKSRSSAYCGDLWKCQLLSCVQFFVTPWTVACHAPLSMEFSRQEHWSGLPCPPPGYLRLEFISAYAWKVLQPQLHPMNRPRHKGSVHFLASFSLGLIPFSIRLPPYGFKMATSSSWHLSH